MAEHKADASRTSVWGEALKGLTCGLVFGVTSPLFGHPLDTVKTRMQAVRGLETGSSLAALRATVAAGGLRCLYRGLLPPLLGSAVFRSAQFSSFTAAHAALGSSERASAPIDALGGMQGRTIAAALVSSTCRAVIETPAEYLKVRRQVGLPWLPPVGDAATVVRTCYTGFGITWARTVCALGGFFLLLDHADRHHPWLGALPGVGPFLKGSVCATAAWWVAWPFEVLKSKTQAHGEAGAHPSVLARGRALLAERGVVGLYRGIGPGTARSIVANGAAFAAFSACTSWL